MSQTCTDPDQIVHHVSASRDFIVNLTDIMRALCAYPSWPLLFKEGPHAKALEKLTCDGFSVTILDEIANECLRKHARLASRYFSVKKHGHIRTDISAASIARSVATSYFDIVHVAGAELGHRSRLAEILLRESWATAGLIKRYESRTKSQVLKIAQEIEHLIDRNTDQLVDYLFRAASDDFDKKAIKKRLRILIERFKKEHGFGIYQGILDER